LKLIGLTGGICCGKSTVADHLRSMGVPVIDADAVSREVVAPDTDGLGAVVARFGAQILQADGHLDREALGAIVVADPEAKADLEAITHPLIQAAIAARMQVHVAAGDPFLVVEAALLVETGSWQLYDQLWVVRSSVENQVQRLMARKQCDEQTARDWVATQLPMEEKARHAHTVIDNDDSLDALKARVALAWNTLKAQASD